MKKKIAIIGGGISGLTVAFRLQELYGDRSEELEIVIFEASKRLGGLIESYTQDGVLFEAGPESFLSEKPWLLDLCKRLGLEKELQTTRRENRRSFLLFGNRLHPIPKGFYLISPRNLSVLFQTPLLSLAAKLRMACDLFIPRTKKEDESVAGFIRRRFGREALERLGQPLIGGIYSADLEKLSMASALPKFWEMEKKHGSLIRALSKKQKIAPDADRASGPRYSLFLTFKEGMQTLINVLAGHLTLATIKTDTEVNAIKKKGRSWQVEGKATSFEADFVCLAIPAFQAGEMVRDAAPALSDLLKSIPYESAATMNLVFERAHIGHALNGFGFVVPATEKKSIIGCTFASVKFAGRVQGPQKVLLRAFIGGALHTELLQLSDTELQKRVLADLKEPLQLRGEPLWVRIHRYKKAMPQYHLGHKERVKEIRETVKNIPGLFITGNAYRGVGLSDAVREAEETAERMLEQLDKVKVNEVAHEV